MNPNPPSSLSPKAIFPGRYSSTTREKLGWLMSSSVATHELGSREKQTGIQTDVYLSFFFRLPFMEETISATVSCSERVL